MAPDLEKDSKTQLTGPVDVAESSSQEDGPSRRTITGFKWVVVVLSVISSTFLYALDNTVMANIRPGIVDTFGHMEMLPWLSVSYPMGEVGANPLWGTLYRQFNNKTLYLVAVLTFEIGSVVIGSAKSVGILIVGRVICGLGGSGIYVGTINIISAMTLTSERAQYLSYVGMAWSLGTILGPIIGGAFNDSPATWRWAFYINICIAAAAAPACILFIPSFTPVTSRSIVQRFKRIDYIGAALFLGGVACIIMILGFGGAIWAWDSRRMIGLYVATVVIWALFALQQAKNILTFDRIFPVELVADWEMCNLFSQTSLAISSIVVTIYMMPLFFQFVYGDSALRSGVFTLPFAFVAVGAAGAGGALFPKYTVYKMWFAVAGIFMLVGSVPLTTVTHTTSRASICGYSVIQGVGCGLIVQLPYTVAGVKVPAKNVRSVTAFLTCAQMAGLALSLGIATCVFVNLATDGIAPILPDVPRSVVQASIGGAGTNILDGQSADVRERVLIVIAKNVSRVFYLNVAGGAWGFLTSLFMKRERLVLET